MFEFKKEKDIIILGEDIYSEVKIEADILIDINNKNYNLAINKTKDKNQIIIIQTYRLIIEHIFTIERFNTIPDISNNQINLKFIYVNIAN